MQSIFLPGVLVLQFFMAEKQTGGLETIVKGACPHDCPDTCALTITTLKGRAIKVEGAKDHPPTDGFLCTKVNRYLERTYSADRLLYPMKRIGRKGEGRFARISWSEAIETISSRFKDIVLEHGPQAILPYSYAGTMGLVQGQSMDRRFFHRLGASLLDRTICASAGAAGYKVTVGASIGTDMERFNESRLVIIWGGNPVTSNVHLWPKILEARRNGARIIAIDPFRSLTAEKCDQHIAPLPGTDGALALAMMHVIIAEGLTDNDYIDKYTIGYQQLRERVKEFSPSIVAKITGIPAEVIISLAREYATTRPSVIRLNYGMQRHAGGGMAVRNIACLPALIGAWRHPAGGILLSSSGTFSVDTRHLEAPELIPPGTRTVNMSAIGEALNGKLRRPDNSLIEMTPPIKGLFVYNSNPVAVAPDSASVIQGMQRDDLFTVVHEIFQTDTADYADILLPATTQLEQFDIHKSYGHLYIVVNNPAIPALGEAKPNSEVFRLLAEAMGFKEACFQESDVDIARHAFNKSSFSMMSFDFDETVSKGWSRLDLGDNYAPFAEGNFPTPSGKCEFYSRTMADQGMDPLPAYIPPSEAITAPGSRFPLAIISPPAHSFLNSSFANLPTFIKGEKEPILFINPEDAGPRGISNSEMVRIWNDRGAFMARAVVSDKARPGVVVAPSVWWKKLTGDKANANDVTSQLLTDLGAAATFYDAAVEVVPV